MVANPWGARRWLVWLPLCLLAVGTGLGTWVAVNAGIPVPTVSQAVAATVATGSARVTAATVVHSTRPPGRSVSNATGLVDFGSATWSLDEANRSAPGAGTGPDSEIVQTRVVGSAGFWRVVPPLPGTGPRSWMRLPRRWAATVTPLMGVAAPALGLLLHAPAQLVLVPVAGGDRGPLHAYDVQPTARLAACLTAHQHAGTSVHTATEVWLDGAGRIVAMRTIERGRVAFPASLPGTPSPVAYESVSTATLGSFGLPVRIEAPPASAVRPSYPGRVIAVGAPC